MSNTNQGGSMVALVTGAFSGIGLVSALRLAQDGGRVYAAGRQLAKSAELSTRARAAGADVRPIVMDVNDEGSIAAALQQIEQESGRLDVLVNNAGISINGAVTDFSGRQLRQMFDTNVFGMVAVTRAALPLMVRQGHGRVINLSSALGKVVFPGAGVYSGTKFAMEALSDAMRMEFKILGPDFHVILIEPGFIKTPLGDNSVDAEYSGNSPFGAAFVQLTGEMARTSINSAPGPEVVAEVIARAVRARQPKARYAVTGQSSMMILLRRLLPDAAFDSIIVNISGLGKYRPSQAAAGKRTAAGAHTGSPHTRAV